MVQYNSFYCVREGKQFYATSPSNRYSVHPCNHNAHILQTTTTQFLRATTTRVSPNKRDIYMCFQPHISEQPLQRPPEQPQRSHSPNNHNAVSPSNHHKGISE